MIAALQVELISLSIFRGSFSQALILFAAQPDPERVGNLPGDGLLDRQDFGDIAAVLFVPQQGAVGHVDQLRLDYETLATHQHAPGEDSMYIEATADGLSIDLATLVAEHRAARHDAQPGKP